MTWKKSDMKQCHRFLQGAELVPCTEFLRIKSLNTTCLKTAWGSNWFHTSDDSVYSPDQGSLTYQMPMFFSKERVIYYKSRSHPDNLVYGWDPLDSPKSDPSDPDNLGHSTHFQPYKVYLNWQLDFEDS